MNRYEYLVTVSSFSNSGTDYKVGKLRRNGKWVCTCPHHEFRRKSCKHIKRAREMRKEGVPSESESITSFIDAFFGKNETS